MSSLKLYNTLTRTKEDFLPADEKNVRMYVCGPTVYDYAHIGNARPVIVFDVLFRLLRHRYGEAHVKYVRNITDVDDKINARAAERGISIRDLTEETNRIFQADVEALGCLPPTVQPRATDHIGPMIEMIERLIANGNAYAADGHVLFSVPSMADYGRLSRRPLDEMIAGARVDVASYKKDEMDFVLWKPSKDDEPGWDSPWGRGRPGWHIECSAMSWKHLGETFDIHGGGIDLVFPHHENEIAQSRCAFGHGVMARYWMHNGFLQVEGEKMSKSLGNFITIHELLTGWRDQPWSGSAIRWNMLQTHYRQPVDWTFAGLLASRNELSRIFLFARRLDEEFSENGGASLLRHVQENYSPSSIFLEALSDDLNTPKAIGAIRENASQLSSDAPGQTMQCLRDLMFLGVVRESTRNIFSTGSTGQNWPAYLIKEIAHLALDLRVARANEDVEFEQQLLNRATQMGLVVSDRPNFGVHLEYVGLGGGRSVQEMVQARLAARAAKNWAESDRIRDELASMGVALKDNKDGTTTWEVKR